MFKLDDKLETSSVFLGDWPLSQVLLKNESAYPWFILVPRKNDISEIYQLEKADRAMLMEEINYLSIIVNNYFHPKKLNIGSLGNQVPQLHMHVVGRNTNDPLWPHGIWQPGFQASPYTERELNALVPKLKDLIKLKNQ